MEPSDSLGPPAPEAWIGRSTTAADRFTETFVRAFRATLEPHLFPVRPGEAPLGAHWCLAPPTAPMGELGPDGHPKRGDFLPPVPLPRRMWAGGEIEHVSVLPLSGDVVRQSTIVNVTHKEGRSGPLCFVAVEHVYSAGGAMAIRERQDIVYRAAESPDAASSAAAPSSGPARASEIERRLVPDPILLFRYSALTFNGHRIHYDVPYTREVEGYPGLVVHGPLQATLLLNLAAELGGQVPARFGYRGLSPLFLGEPVLLRAARKGPGEIETWLETPGGRTHMSALARFGP